MEEYDWDRSMPSPAMRYRVRCNEVKMDLGVLGRSRGLPEADSNRNSYLEKVFRLAYLLFDQYS